MFLSPQVGLKALAQLCRRLAVATGAGLLDRRIWQSETERGARSQRAVAAEVSDRLAKGDSIADALAATGDYFPPLYRQMVAVGDASGQLDRTYRRLAEHYETLLAARRTLVGALAWPMIQLAIAVVTIGVVIWISSFMNLRTLDGQPLDIFGFGLTGSGGLAVYLVLVALAAMGAYALVEAVRRGVLWTRGLQRAALRIPGLGHALETLALARFTWALQLVLDSALDLRKALPLALDASGNDAYRRIAPDVVRSIGQGNSLHSALAETGAFPRDLLDAIAVGEESGMLAETMQRQSKEYQHRAAEAVGVLAKFLGGAIWVGVALVLIALIFRVNSARMNMINSLLK